MRPNQYSTGLTLILNPNTPVALDKRERSLSRFRSTLDFEKRTHSLLTAEAKMSILKGELPDVSSVCHDLIDTFSINNYPYNATQFLSAIKRFELSKDDIIRIKQSDQTRHVLVQNQLLKVVLIHWKSGESSSIHGHPAGGCVFKVLSGRIIETRFSTESIQDLVGSSEIIKGGVAYIDDSMAFHAVGNHFDESAISLHVYTPGIR